MKLIKLNIDHYVVVDDSEIKEGDWYYWEVTKTIQIAKLDSLNRLPKSSDGSKKITHSTQPLEDVQKEYPYLGHNNLVKHKGYDKIKSLSLSEVKELLGEVDVEKKVRNEIGIPNYLPTNSMSPSMQGSLEFGIKCYNQALEDNKEKVIIFICKYLGVEKDSIIYNKIIKNWEQSIQPKTEWEVEFIDGKLKLKS